ncbi:MAG: hypothetical protein ACTSRU_00815 [Candidatus Hodarchaeales archaeon]
MADQKAPRKVAVSIRLYIIPLIICVSGIGLFLINSLFKDINSAREIPDSTIDHLTGVLAIWGLIFTVAGFLIVFFITTILYSVKSFQSNLVQVQDHEKSFLASTSVDEEFDKKRQATALIKEIDDT